MIGPDVFQVDSGSLVVHAGEVERIGDGLSTAGDAGRAVRTDSSAYAVARLRNVR